MMLLCSKYSGLRAYFSWESCNDHYFYSHFRGFSTNRGDDVTDNGYRNDEVLYWTDRIERAARLFGEVK